EGSDQVLSQLVVDANLAANRCVDLREQRRGNVDERDAAQVGGGSEAGDVTDDPSAERDEGRGTVGVRTDERVVDSRYGAEVLRALAVRDKNGLSRGNRPSRPLPVELPDERARHDEAP